MALDQGRVPDFACSYADAWCSHDPAKVARQLEHGAPER